MLVVDGAKSYISYISKPRMMFFNSLTWRKSGIARVFVVKLTTLVISNSFLRASADLKVFLIAISVPEISKAELKVPMLISRSLVVLFFSFLKTVHPLYKRG